MTISTVCFYSGTKISTSFNSTWELLDNRSLLIGWHPVFNLSIRELIDTSTQVLDWLTGTTPATISEEEIQEVSHLLCLAIAHKFSVLDQSYPVHLNCAGLVEVKRAEFLLKGIRALGSLIKIQSKWKKVVDNSRVPTLVIRHENISEVNIPAFFNELIFPTVTSIANSPEVLLGTLLKEAEPTSEEIAIEKERELQKYLHSTKYTGSIAYTPKLGLAVVKQLAVELQIVQHEIISLTQIALWQDLVAKPFAQLSGIHPDKVRELMKLIKDILKISCDPADEVLRTYIALTLKHLSTLIEYHTDLSLMFSSSGSSDNTRLETVEVPEALGTGWTIRVPTTSPFTEATVPTSELSPAAKRIRDKLLAIRGEK